MIIQGKRYYYVKWNKGDKYVYLGNREQPDVKRICETHFLKEILKRIDNNIKLIHAVKDGYLEIDPYAVNSALRESLQCSLPPVSMAYQQEGEKWLEKSLAIQAAFPENYPEKKTERTSDGVMVKSVSEVVLYERFKSAGLFQIYELPLVLNDYGPAMYPDFTVLSPVDLKTVFFVEYVGRLDLPKYREEFARRIRRYISNGYIPGINVFFIYGDKDGHIDSVQINKVIADIKGGLRKLSA